MSFFQFAAAIGGFAKANGGGPADGMSPEEEAELAAWLDEPPIWDR